MAPKRIWAADEIADICARYQAMQTRVAIAKHYGTKPAVIRDILTAQQVPLRRDTGKYLHKYTPEVESEIVARYLGGETMESIQHAYHMQPITLRRMVTRHGGKMRHGGPPRQWMPEEIAQIRQMIAEGKSRHAIAEALHTKPSTLYLVIRNHGLTQPRSGIAKREYVSGWNGGRHITRHGYVQVLISPDHPMAGSRMGMYVLEHRAVMAEHLGRPLRRDETVHHINGNRQDNRIENLQLRQGKHGNGVVYVCLDCGSHNVKPMGLSERRAVYKA